MLSAGTSSYASHHAPCPPTPLPPFASCSTGAGCHITPVVVLPPPLVLSTRGLRLGTCHCLFSTSPPGCLLFAGWLSCCILSLRLHLVSPFVPPPPHMSILDPPPSFAPAGCCVASCRAASTSRPLVNTTASQRAAASRRAGNSTSRLPFVCPNWLLRCLMWHLRLTSASLPSPPPLPLVTSRSRLP